MHPTVVSDGFARAAEVALEAVESLALPVALADKDELAKSASTSLQSKVVSQHAALLAPMAVDCVLKGKENFSYDFKVVLRDQERARKRKGNKEELALKLSFKKKQIKSTINQSSTPTAPRPSTSATSASSPSWGAPSTTPSSWTASSSTSALPAERGARRGSRTPRLP